MTTCPYNVSVSVVGLLQLLDGFMMFGLCEASSGIHKYKDKGRAALVQQNPLHLVGCTIGNGLRCTDTRKPWIRWFFFADKICSKISETLKTVNGQYFRYFSSGSMSTTSELWW